jgi:hypothetical protein
MNACKQWCMRNVITHVPTTVFLCMILIGCSAGVLVMLLMVGWGMRDLPSDGGLTLLTLPLCALVGCLWYRHRVYALYGTQWNVSLACMLGMIIVVILSIVSMATILGIPY